MARNPDERGEIDSRTERAFARADALGRSKAAEARAAAELLIDFAARARASGLSPTRLRAKSYSGDARYRSNIDGWYLRRDLSIGVGLDGRFYVLSTPASLAARVTGVTLAPSAPPMELGRGARDGQSIPLAEALQRRLDAGDAFP